jgi:esterase/lipase superfamily enzyme
MSDYVLCIRNIDASGNFGDKPDQSRYLKVADGQPWTPVTEMADRQKWVKAIINDANAATDDILIFIHGYNNSQNDVKTRHDQLKGGLQNLGFKGVVVSFDWPSGDNVLAYLRDRSVANQVAQQLVSDGIMLLSQFQSPDCQFNVHLLGHSTGAYLIREAFDRADDTLLPNSSWMISQIALISGDVSSNSMSADDSESKSIYLHCVRLTNYSNSYDEVLGISNVKRLGVAPRVGRIGLPDDSSDTAVNVDCSDYYKNLPDDGKDLTFSHSWQFNDQVFIHDLYSMISGVDRGSMPTRKQMQPPKPHRFKLVQV